MKLKEIKFIKGKIILKTGLHIGTGSDEIKIGGIDNPVVKDPLTDYPYIPGSSIKGKVRTLLEWLTGNIAYDGKPFSTEEMTIQLQEFLVMEKILIIMKVVQQESPFLIVNYLMQKNYLKKIH